MRISEPDFRQHVELMVDALKSGSTLVLENTKKVFTGLISETYFRTVLREALQQTDELSPGIADWLANYL